MTLILQFAAFVLGVLLSIRMIAALHGIADLWFMIERAWMRVVGGIAGWGAIIILVAWLLEAPYRSAFLWGLLAYFAFYLSLLPLVRLYLAVRRTDRSVE